MMDFFGITNLQQHQEALADPASTRALSELLRQIFAKIKVNWFPVTRSGVYFSQDLDE